MKKETEIKIKHFEVKQYCDKCGEELKFTGEVLLSNPEKYVHKCEKCGNTEWLDKKYPCIEERKVEINPISGIEITDDFKKTLKRINTQREENVFDYDPTQKELIFSLNPAEAKEYYDFCEEHKNCKEFNSTTGGKIAITFIPTGLGDVKIVRCKSCRTEKDITDVKCW